MYALSKLPFCRKSFLLKKKFIQFPFSATSNYLNLCTVSLRMMHWFLRCTKRNEFSVNFCQKLELWGKICFTWSYHKEFGLILYLKPVLTLYLKVVPGIDHLVRSLQACVIWLTAAQTGGQYLREDHTPKIGMKFSCQFIDERSVSSHKPKLLQRERRASSAPQSRENPQKLKLLVLRDIFLFNKGKFQIGKRNLEERS